MSDAVWVKTTQDGRRVEVIDGWVCLAGAREADSLIPMEEHPNRQAIAKAEAAVAQSALSAAQRIFDASPAGSTQRLRHAVWAKAAAEGVE